MSGAKDEAIKAARNAAAANLAAIQKGHSKLRSAYQKGRTSEYKESFIRFPLEVPVKAHPRLYTTASELFGQSADAVDAGKWRSEQQTSYEKSYSAADLNATERAGATVVKDNSHPTFFAWHRMDRYAEGNAKDPCGPPGGSTQQGDEYVEDGNLSMSEYDRQYKWLPIDAQARDEGHRHGAESASAEGAQKGLTLLPNYDAEANESTWATETHQQYVPITKAGFINADKNAVIAGKASAPHDVIPTFYAWEEEAEANVDQQQQQQQQKTASGKNNRSIGFDEHKEGGIDNNNIAPTAAASSSSEFLLPIAGKPTLARGPAPFFYAWENGSVGAGSSEGAVQAAAEEEKESTSAAAVAAAEEASASAPVAGAATVRREATPFFYAWDPDAAAHAIVEEEKNITRASYDGDDTPAGKRSAARIVPPTFYAWDPEGAARSISDDNSGLKAKSKSIRLAAAEADKRESENDRAAANVRDFNFKPEFMLLRHPAYFAWGPDAGESSANADPHTRERHLNGHSEYAENFIELPVEVALAAKASPVRRNGNGNWSPTRNPASSWNTENHAQFKPFPIPKSTGTQQPVAGVAIGASTSSSSAAIASAMRTVDSTTALWKTEYESRYIPASASSYERPKTAPAATATAPPAVSAAAAESSSSSEVPALKPAVTDSAGAEVAVPSASRFSKTTAGASSSTARKSASASAVAPTRNSSSSSTKTKTIVETRRGGGKAAAKNDNLVDTSATTVSWKKVPLPYTQRFNRSSPVNNVVSGPSWTGSVPPRKNSKVPNTSWGRDEVADENLFSNDDAAGAAGDVDTDGLTTAADSVAATAGRHLNSGEGVSHASLAPSASSTHSVSVAGATGAPTDDAAPLSGRFGSDRNVSGSSGLRRPATADSTLSRRSGSSISSSGTTSTTNVAAGASRPPSHTAAAVAASKQKETYLRAPFATTDSTLLKSTAPITAETVGIPNPRRSSFSGEPQTESQYQQASGRLWHGIPNRMTIQDSAGVDSGYRQETDPASQRSRSVPTIARRITQSTLAPNPVKAPSRQASWADESFNPFLFNKRFPAVNPHHQASRWQTESHGNYNWKQPESSIDPNRRSATASELASRASKATKRAVDRFAKTALY